MVKICLTALLVLWCAACGGSSDDSLQKPESESARFQFDGWVLSPAPGCATAIGSPSWVIGCTHTPDGFNYSVYHLIGTGWSPIPGSAATHIAVSPEGVPWVVDARGTVLKYNGSSFVRILTPGCAMDIGVGANDSAWVIGCDAPVAGERPVYYLVGSPAASTSRWHQFPSVLAKRITVSPEGTPWIVNAAGTVERLVSITFPSGVTSSAFFPLPTGPGDCASSIGVGSGGVAWKLDCGFVAPYGFGIYQWNGSAWTQVPGLAVGLSVEPTGRPSVINQPGSIFTAREFLH